MLPRGAAEPGTQHDGLGNIQRSPVDQGCLTPFAVLCLQGGQAEWSGLYLHALHLSASAPTHDELKASSLQTEQSPPQMLCTAHSYYQQTLPGMRMFVIALFYSQVCHAARPLNVDESLDRARVLGHVVAIKVDGFTCICSMALSCLRSPRASLHKRELEDAEAFVHFGHKLAARSLSQEES